MKEIPAITKLLDRLRALQAEAERLNCLPAAAEIARRLNGLQLDLDLGVTAAGPFTIALLGGTGVGKSRLFNALIGREGASPVSDAIRGYTGSLYVAVDPAYQRAVRAHPVGALGPAYVDVEGWKNPLVDTPDIDSAVTENLETTKRCIKVVDMIIYITVQEKMNVYDIVKEIRQSAPLKRWLFVMNKVDLEQECAGPEKVFKTHLQSLGFEPEEGVRFMVSAAHPDRFDDLARLRATLMSERSENQVEAMRFSNFLSLALDAVAVGETKKVSDMCDILSTHEEQYNKQYRDSYLVGLQSPLAREALRAVVRTRV